MKERMRKWVVAHSLERRKSKRRRMMMNMRVLEIKPKRTKHPCGSMSQDLEEG